MTSVWRVLRRNPGWLAVTWLMVSNMLLVLPSCGAGKSIRRYQPEVQSQYVTPKNSSSDIVLSVVDFSAGAAYDEERMVFRAGDFRFDYYHFHRWAAPPGQLVSDLLSRVYSETDAFKAVVSGHATRSDVILSGHVHALEEVDVSKKKWVARVVLDLQLRDAVTGDLVWNRQLQERVPLDDQSPLGLAGGVSRAVTKMGSSSVDELLEASRKVKERRTTGPPNLSPEGVESSGGPTPPDPPKSPTTDDEEGASTEGTSSSTSDRSNSP